MNPTHRFKVPRGSREHPGPNPTPTPTTAGVDNVTLNLGAGGDVVAADDIAGIKFQRIKLIYGPDNVSKGDVDTTNPLPVTVSSPTVISNRATFTGSITDSALVTPTSGKQLNVTRLTVTTDNDNVGKLTFRIGPGTTNTPTTSGVIQSHPGLGNGRDFTVGNGRDTIGLGAVNQPLRMTAVADAAAVYDVDYEYFES